MAGGKRITNSNSVFPADTLLLHWTSCHGSHSDVASKIGAPCTVLWTEDADRREWVTIYTE
jgi:hypothetical protein